MFYWTKIGKIMGKYKFLLICVVNVATLEICSCVAHKDKKSADLSTDVIKKRAEYEKSFMNASSTSNAYNKWPELEKNDELAHCQKYVGTLFSKKPRTVVSANIFNLWLHYKELKHDNGKEIDTVPVIALQCEISPRIGSRKFIQFIKSPKTDCLYLASQLIPHTKKFHIVDEICLSKNYKFYKICNFNTYEANRLKKKRKNYYHYPCKNDSIDERRHYEKSHYYDYTSKSEQYKAWPALNEEELNMFCRGLMENLFQNYQFSSIIGEVRKIRIYYKKTDIKDIELISMVDVNSVVCVIPDKKQSNNFKFIKSAMPCCVYLVKQVHPRCSFYYIGKQICKKNISHHGCEMDMQVKENEKMESANGDSEQEGMNNLSMDKI